MRIIESLSDGRQKAELSDGRTVLLSEMNIQGDYIVFDINGWEFGTLQRIGRDQTTISYIFLEELPDRIKISYEEEHKPVLEPLDKLKQDYNWIFSESEGGPEIIRLFELKANPKDLRDFLELMKNKNVPERKRRWKVIRKMIHLIDNPVERISSENLTFWIEKVLPFLQLLKITLPDA